jgi:hypothetical protein
MAKKNKHFYYLLSALLLVGLVGFFSCEQDPEEKDSDDNGFSLPSPIGITPVSSNDTYMVYTRSTGLLNTVLSNTITKFTFHTTALETEGSTVDMRIMKSVTSTYSSSRVVKDIVGTYSFDSLLDPKQIYIKYEFEVSVKSNRSTFYIPGE